MKFVVPQYKGENKGHYSPGIVSNGLLFMRNRYYDAGIGRFVQMDPLGLHGNDINLSSQTQVRPLIYPSELQRLNKPGDIGHSIIVTFGNYPLKTYFSPSFKVPFYVTGRMDTSGLEDRYFDENAILYDIRERNKIVFEKNNNTADKNIKRKTAFSRMLF